MPDLPSRDAVHVAHLGTSVTLAAIGGYLDAFTYLGHGHVFANAQTGNVVLLGLSIVAGHPSLRHLPPILFFLLGIAAARALQMPAALRRLRYLYTCVLLVETAAFLGICLLPRTVPDLCITTAISFFASMQVETFNEVNGARYNSTFTTGNLRTLSENLFDWLARRRTPQTRVHIRDFASVCLAFFLGAAAGGFCTPRLGNSALWVVILTLLALAVRLAHGARTARTAATAV